MDELSQRQQEILNFIRQEVQKKGYPPSVREIGEAVGTVKYRHRFDISKDIEDFRRREWPEDPDF